jgi:hypothetical protein
VGDLAEGGVDLDPPQAASWRSTLEDEAVHFREANDEVVQEPRHPIGEVFPCCGLHQPHPIAHTYKAESLPGNTQTDPDLGADGELLDVGYESLDELAPDYLSVPPDVLELDAPADDDPGPHGLPSHIPITRTQSQTAFRGLTALSERANISSSPRY